MNELECQKLLFEKHNAFLLTELQKKEVSSFADVIILNQKLLNSIDHIDGELIHSSLERGVKSIESPLQLLYYFKLYAKKHKSRIQNLMSSSLNRITDKMDKFTIIDYGCGQGTATLILLDIIMNTPKYNNLLSKIDRIILIDNSVYATERAEMFISSMLKMNQIDIVKYQIDLNYLSHKILEKIETKDALHLFANILDVPGIHASSLATKLTTVPSENNSVICISPAINENRNVRFSRFIEQISYECEIQEFEIDLEGLYATNARIFSFIHASNCMTDPNEIPVQAYDEVFKKLDELYGKKVSRNVQIGDTNLDFLVITDTSIQFYILTNIARFSNHKIPQTIRNDFNKCKQDLQDILFQQADTNLQITDIWPFCKFVIIITDLYLTDKNNFAFFTLLRRSGKMISVFPNVSAPSDYERLYKEQDKSRKKLTEEVLNIICDKINSKNLINKLPSYNYNIQLSKKQMQLSESKAGFYKVNGSAGSGKTIVLIKRALNCYYQTGGSILILTYNITLKNYISSILNYYDDTVTDNITIKHYHQFISDFIKQNEPECNYEDWGNIYSDIEKITNVLKMVAKKDLNKLKFDGIFIDEGQDFEYEWFQILKEFLNSRGEFVIMADKAQNLYEIKLDDNKQVKTIVPGQWNQLNECHRTNNPNILNLYIEFIIRQSGFESQLFAKSEFEEYRKMETFINFEGSFSKAKYLFYSNQEQDLVLKYIANISDLQNWVILSKENWLLAEIDAYLLKEKLVEKTQTTFITDQEMQSHDLKNDKFRDNFEKSKKRNFVPEAVCLKLSTIYSFKGWDTDNVILLINDSDNLFHIYCGLTRPRNKLIIINRGNKLFDDFITEQEEGVFYERL